MELPDDGSIQFEEFHIGAAPELSAQTISFFGGTQAGICVHRSDQTLCVVFQQQTVEWETNDTPSRFGASETEPAWPSLPTPPSPSPTHSLVVTDWEGENWGSIAEVAASWRKEGYWEWDPDLGSDVFKVANIWRHRKMRWRWRWFATQPFASCWHWFHVIQQRAAVDYLDTESGVPTPTLQDDPVELKIWTADEDWADRDPEDWEDWGGTEWVTWAPEPPAPPDPVASGPTIRTQEAVDALALLFPCRQSGGHYQGNLPGFVPGGVLPWLIHDHPRGLGLPVGGA